MAAAIKSRDIIEAAKNRDFTRVIELVNASNRNDISNILNEQRNEVSNSNSSK